MSRAYYNEIDPDAVAVLRQLISDGVIAPGDVDDRSIKDVRPDDLDGYTQAHFFAGGGLWSVAARLAGWPDSEPLWTGSAPCQPFSAAGRGLGTDDPRHLWPDLHRLIRARRPVVVMGEQVTGAAGRAWFNGVRADLAGCGYAGRAVDIPACAVDAPHQRNRLWWIAVADAAGSGRDRAEIARADCRTAGASDAANERWAAGLCQPERLHGGGHVGHADCTSGGRLAGSLPEPQGEGARSGQEHRRVTDRRGPADGRNGALGDAGREGLPAPERAAVLGQGRWEEGRAAQQSDGALPRRNGSWWADAEWIACHDGKARRAKPGTPMLVDGLPGRVGLWRIAGNAVSPILAAEVIAAFRETYTHHGAAP